MTRVIYKYYLKPGGETILEDYIAGFLDAQVQDGQLVIWAETSPYLEEDGRLTPRNDKRRRIRVTCIGTGWPYESNGVGQYFKTVQMPNGLVWHLFVEEVL